MIEAGLQQEINYVMTQARNNRLEFVTVEHLLLALLNIDEVVTFLRTKRVNVDELRGELEEYIDSHTPLIPQESEVDIVPTVGFQRVLQRSVYQAQSAQNHHRAGRGSHHYQGLSTGGGALAPAGKCRPQKAGPDCPGRQAVRTANHEEQSCRHQCLGRAVRQDGRGLQPGNGIIPWRVQPPQPAGH